MSKILLICFVASLLLGCSELQMKQMDQTVEGIDDAAGAMKDAVEGPGGALMPPEWKGIVVLGTGIAGLLTGIWKDFRARQAKNALTEVVIGVENLKKEDNMAGDVKEAMNTAQGGTTRKLVETIRRQI